MREDFKDYWKIVLPDSLTLEFYESPESFNGDGIRYTVLKAESEPTDFLSEFSLEKDESFEKTVKAKISNTEFQIPENFLPDWQQEYYWKHVGKNPRDKEPIRYNDNLYMLYFQNSQRLILCQSFT